MLDLLANILFSVDACHGASEGRAAMRGTAKRSRALERALIWAAVNIGPALCGNSSHDMAHASLIFSF